MPKPTNPPKEKPQPSEKEVKEKKERVEKIKAKHKKYVEEGRHETRIIKDALIEEFGKNRVISVTHGRGTSRHWIYATLFYPYYEDTLTPKDIQKIRERAYAVIRESGVKISKYPDEITEQQHECLQVTVRTIL